MLAMCGNSVKGGLAALRGARMRHSAASPLRPLQSHRAMILRMIDNKPEASETVQDSKPHPPLVFPSNFVDRTAERSGTIIGVVGATGRR